MALGHLARSRRWAGLRQVAFQSRTIKRTTDGSLFPHVATIASDEFCTPPRSRASRHISAKPSVHTVDGTECTESLTSHWPCDPHRGCLQRVAELHQWRRGRMLSGWCCARTGASSTSGASSVMHGRQASTWRPSAPRNQSDESGIRRIDVELPASQTTSILASTCRECTSQACRRRQQPSWTSNDAPSRDRRALARRWR